MPLEDSDGLLEFISEPIKCTTEESVKALDGALARVLGFEVAVHLIRNRNHPNWESDWWRFWNFELDQSQREHISARFIKLRALQ